MFCLDDAAFHERILEMVDLEKLPNARLAGHEPSLKRFYGHLLQNHGFGE